MTFDEFKKRTKITELTTPKGDGETTMFYLNLSDGKPGDPRFQATATTRDAIEWEQRRAYDSYLIEELRHAKQDSR